jgi:putative transposase
VLLAPEGMQVKPRRPPERRNGEIYFVTSATAERAPFFRYERWCALFIEVLYQYRQETFRLHEFVLMPDHFHLLMAPTESLERAMQLIKGGFSRRAALQFETTKAIWQRGFTDHRIRDAADYDRHKHCIWQNPVKAGMCLEAAQYPYGSASSRYELDPIPQGLKPLKPDMAGGTA